jgi:hypothetical protein
MLVQYSNFIAFHSFTDDFLELVDLIDEKGYKPSVEAGHDLHDEIKRLQMGKFDKDRVFNLALRKDRGRVYELVLQEGNPGDISSIIDGALLIDLWNEIVISKKIRSEWQPLVDQALAG